MFCRYFLKENDIRFHPISRANEDNGFMKLCKLYATKYNNSIFLTNRVVYSWHFSRTSITRINKGSYEFGTSTRDNFYGYIENMLYSVHHVKKHKIFEHSNEMINFITEVMIGAFVHYVRTYSLHQDKAKKTLEYCKWFYEDAYADIEEYVDSEFIKNSIFNFMKNEYNNGAMYGVEPVVTFQQFLDLLKAEDVKTEE